MANTSLPRSLLKLVLAKIETISEDGYAPNFMPYQQWMTERYWHQLNDEKHWLYCGHYERPAGMRFASVFRGGPAIDLTRIYLFNVRIDDD